MTTLTFRKPSALPGFGLTLGITVAYLSLVVLIPLAATFLKTATLDWSQFVRAVSSPRVLASYRLTFFSALGGALINAVFGFLVAWVLVRYTFPFKRIVDAVVDLPFALCHSVAGISLAAVYAGNGWIGQFLEPLGLKIALRRRRADRADLYRFAVRRADRAAGARRVRTRAGRGRCVPRRLALADVSPRGAAGGVPCLADRFRAGLRAGARRIRVGDFHRR
jgi:ABC-type sulfate transport system, permease component